MPFIKWVKNPFYPPENTGSYKYSFHLKMYYMCFFFFQKFVCHYLLNHKANLLNFFHMLYNYNMHSLT